MRAGHEQYDENIAPYLLGALPELEAQLFERHLETCPDCRLALERLRVAAEALPQAVEPLEPPPELKESLMQTVWAEAETRPGGLPKRHAARSLLGRPLRLGSARAVVATACALAIGVGIGIAVGNGGGGGGHETVSARVDHSRAPSGDATLTLPAGKAGGAILTVHGLPDPGPGRVYEAWVERQGRMHPAGALFSVGSGGSGAAAIPGSLEGAQAIAVTAEPDGGSSQPTQAPLLTVNLS